MVTLAEAIMHLIKKQSDTIHDIKAAALKIETTVEYAWSSPDGSTVVTGLSTKPEGRAGWKTTEITRARVVAHMSPKHPDWKKYRAARSYASQLLTARLLLKLGDDNIPDMPAANVALKAGKLMHHSRPGHARRLTLKALRTLRKLQHRIERNPERFTDARIWIDQRATARTLRKETPDAK
ncbi:MAG TPA: hypothetical protein VFV34_24345 [Blastocatellia bacterium]|nr:hypothetical protein [Blastocatellia bacterium]